MFHVQLQPITIYQCVVQLPVVDTQETSRYNKISSCPTVYNIQHVKESSFKSGISLADRNCRLLLTLTDLDVLEDATKRQDRLQTIVCHHEYRSGTRCEGIRISRV